jgi:hypothetical protein
MDACRNNVWPSIGSHMFVARRKLASGDGVRRTTASLHSRLLDAEGISYIAEGGRGRLRRSSAPAIHGTTNENVIV